MLLSILTFITPNVKKMHLKNSFLNTHDAHVRRVLQKINQSTD